jgi:hypothetical protein
MPTVEEIFAPVIGKIAFSFKQTHGSCFFIQFGDPYRRIREPIEPKHTTDEKVMNLLRRRQVFAVGSWSLLVLGCNWTLRNKQMSVCQDDGVDDMEDLFRGVEGQYLVSAHGVEETKSYMLEFDMGANLELQPRHDWKPDLDPDENQWQLHFKDRSSVGYTNNGSFEFESTSNPEKP